MSSVRSVVELDTNVDAFNGDVFGELTITSLSKIVKYKSSRNAIFNCICSCGSNYLGNLWDMRAGHIKNCGCRRDLKYKEQAYKSFVTGMYCVYRHATRKRSYSFEISKQELECLITDNCHYCGSIPLNRYKGNGKYVDYKYNGIDRIDNDLGYFKENCVPCCFVCNRAKSTMGNKEFCEWISRIKNHNCVSCEA